MIFLCRDVDNDDADEWTEIIEHDMEDAAMEFADRRKIWQEPPYEMTVAVKQPLGDEYRFELDIEMDPRINIARRLGKTNGSEAEISEDA